MYAKCSPCKKGHSCASTEVPNWLHLHTHTHTHNVHIHSDGVASIWTSRSWLSSWLIGNKRCCAPGVVPRAFTIPFFLLLSFSCTQMAFTSLPGGIDSWKRTVTSWQAHRCIACMWPAVVSLPVRVEISLSLSLCVSRSVPAHLSLSSNTIRWDQLCSAMYSFSESSFSLSTVRAPLNRLCEYLAN